MAGWGLSGSRGRVNDQQTSCDQRAHANELLRPSSLRVGPIVRQSDPLQYGSEAMILPAMLLLAQLHGTVSARIYTSPSGSYRVRLPHLLEQGVQITDEIPDTNVQMLSVSDDLCREFIITERPGELPNDSLRAWVDTLVIPKLRAIGAEVRETRVVGTREGPAVYVRYHHPRAASCTRPNDTLKADADVAVYIYHIGNRFYRMLYVLGERPDLRDTVLGVLRAPADTVLSRFADGFAVSRWATRPPIHPRFASLSLGNAFSCGLSTDSIPYCWGAGRDPASYSLTPTPLPAALKFAQLAAGENFSCGVVTTGAAYCWGGNYLGVLGIGSDTVRARFNPTLVIGGLKYRGPVCGHLPCLWGDDVRCRVLLGRQRLWRAGYGRHGSSHCTHGRGRESAVQARVRRLLVHMWRHDRGRSVLLGQRPRRRARCSDKADVQTVRDRAAL